MVPRTFSVTKNNSIFPSVTKKVLGTIYLFISISSVTIVYFVLTMVLVHILIQWSFMRTFLYIIFYKTFLIHFVEWQQIRNRIKKQLCSKHTPQRAQNTKHVISLHLYRVPHFLPPANEVWGKVIFSQACVKNSVHKGGVWSWGVPAVGGAWSWVGVCSQGGAWSGGVCSQGGEPGPGGVCSRGVPDGDPPG